MDDIELAEAFVHVSHPASDGWKRVYSPKLNHLDVDLEVDMLMYKRGHAPIAVVHMATPYVSKQDLDVAKQLRTLLQTRLNGREVKVLLVYREILARPQKIPPGISIMSIIEGRNEMGSPN